MKRPQFLHRPAAWLLALAMVLSLLPPLSLTAHAFTTYSLHIGNTQFTSENLTITDENGGTATFDPDTNTLALTDFTYEGAGFRGTTIHDEAAIYSLLDNLTILLSGNNVLTHVTNADDAPAFSFGLYSRGPVTVDVLPGAEYGRLVLNGGTSPNYSYGIKVDKSLTVNDGTLYATGGEAPYNTGIYTGYNLTVHDGMVLASCKAATTLSYGINTYAYDAENEAYNGGLYMNGGTVYAQTTEAPTCIAINSNHNITITDGFVSATGGIAEKGSCGMAASLISLQGGEVVTTGGTCPDGSYGIIAGDIFRMDGGKLTAKAGETELGYGIAAQNGIEISSGTVTAQGIGGAMTHAPMADSYDHFSFWYGDDEASAMAAGVKPGSLIPDYCGKPYVHFTDSNDSTDTPITPEPANPTFAKAFPDPIFRAYVTDTVLWNNSEDKSDDANITDAQMEIIEGWEHVDVSETEVVSLQGLEYFTALKYLSCHHTALTALDLSSNPALLGVQCDFSPITQLDVSGCPKLVLLSCSNLSITALDVSHNPALTDLYCWNNNLTKLDVSGNPELTELWCNNTGITELDVSSNPALTDLRCNGTYLTALDVSKNTALKTLYCYNTGIAELNVSNMPALTDLRCYNTYITTLDISSNTALQTLWIFNNEISELDLSNNTKLVSLDCYGTALTALDLRKLHDLDILNSYLGPQHPTKTDVKIMPSGDVWTLDMAAFLGSSGNIDYVTMTDGGVLENGIVTYATKPETVTYTYDTGMGDMDVTWTPVFEDAHTHSYSLDFFDWASDLSYAGVYFTCEGCGSTHTEVAYPYWREVSAGRLVKTAEVTLDGVTYAEDFVITAERTGNTVTLHLPGLIFAEQIIVAGYNEDGQMTECQITKDYSLTMTFTVTAPEVRVFFLDSSFDPQTLAMIV